MEALDGQAARTIGEALDLAPAVAELLVCRGIDTVEKAKEFLYPSQAGFHDPLRLRGMAGAAARIRRAMDAGERIMLYGDYDVDGVSGTAMLLTALGRHGAAVDYYIPCRHTEGYGVNEEAVRWIAGRGTGLLVTIDCGITNRKEIALARALGMDAVVTDHHQCPERLPECPVVNPHLPGQAYPFDGLCGAGVAFKLVDALFGREEAMRYADLAALATVADIVPLTGENRILTKMGLASMNENPRTGIRALLRVSGLEGKEIGAGHLGFQLGPRINAGGRMDLARKSVRLLMTEDEETAAALAAELDRDNEARKEVCARMEREACDMAGEREGFCDSRAVVLWRDGWNSGVLGIVAGKLAERYYRPVVLLAREGDRYHGSARGIPGVHLFRMLERCEDLFIRFGGHEQAAGMTMEKGALEAFRERFEETLRTCVGEEVFTPTRYFDRTLAIREIDDRLMANLDQLRPTGYGNARPVFLLSPVRMSGIRTMGTDGRHYRAAAVGDERALSLVAFGQKPPLLGGADHDALVCLEEDEWQGEKKFRGHLLALRTRATAEDVFAAMEGMREAFAASLWQQFLPAEEGEPNPNVAARTAGEYCDDLARAGNPSGRLVLLPEEESARKAVAILARRGLLDRFEVRCGGELQGQPGDNVLALAPDFTALTPWYWSEIHVWGGILCTDFIISRLSRLSRANIGFIMENEYEEMAREALRSCGMNDGLLRALYVRVRKGVSEGVTFREAREPAVWLARQCGVLEASADAGLRILAELSLINLSEEPPYLVYNERPGKVSLADSATYRRIGAALNQS